RLTELQEIISVNLLAAMELSRLLLPSMLRQGNGHIVNIASTAAKKGHPFDSAYSASKAGLLMWNDALRQELQGSGVAVSAICPGYVEQCGMMVDTSIHAPRWAGATTPEKVAQATVTAIARNQPEVIISKDAFSALINKALFASWQFFPQWGDAIYRTIGIPQLNQQRITAQRATAEKESSLPQTQSLQAQLPQTQEVTP
ncbi:MAG: SDR family NAD(P)-dependent oxidoreductase, partial [Cyanobacteria bacterium J06598_3]